MPPAIIAGGIAAAGTIGGAILSNKSQSKATAQAAQTQDNATAAQLQLGQQSLALNQGIYNSNYDLLSPYVSRGNVAGGAINALLGLPSAPAMHSPLAAAPTTPVPATGAVPSAPSYPGFPYAATAQGVSPNIQMAARSAATAAEPTPATPYPGFPYAATAAAAPVMAANGSTTMQPSGNFVPLPDRGDRPSAADYHGDHQAYNAAMDAWRHTSTTGAASPPAAGGTPAPAAGGAHPVAGGSAATTAQQAMQNFANSAGMQFQLQQGTNALNNMYAGRGMLQSGAAMKGIQNYGQQTALNNYFMPYMGLLGGQQAVGAGAASSVAGVGANFGNTAAGINSQMGNAINSGAQNIGNLQLANGQNQSNMYGAIGGALGGLASSFIPTPKY